MRHDQTHWTAYTHEATLDADINGATAIQFEVTLHMADDGAIIATEVPGPAPITIPFGKPAADPVSAFINQMVSRYSQSSLGASLLADSYGDYQDGRRDIAAEQAADSRRSYAEAL